MDDIYLVIYKMNVDQATNNDENKCYMDDVITLWQMNNDWYCMMKIPDYNTRWVEYYLSDAYKIIGEKYITGKATIIFESVETF